MVGDAADTNAVHILQLNNGWKEEKKKNKLY